MTARSIREHRTLVGLAVIAALAVAGELTGTSPLLLGGGQAHAVIGRPLTPMSYAGVARRTTRRAAYAGAVAAPYAGAVAAPYAGAVAAPVPVAPAAGVVTALPGGCARADATGGVYYQCGGARYQPYYYGSTLVYRPL